ncbi:hypothetical protein OESDEN_15343 [Oesophagostomum dentatum]|uniref:Uncharacterized protein n=1 Tax=Oesophagostomum dentatum TaxID=61180 RepID=A0A0B1SN35_OESDE|nr:hypothetical protein OESDEN_15343 [Oesophagostomum dentatum]
MIILASDQNAKREWYAYNVQVDQLAWRSILFNLSDPTISLHFTANNCKTLKCTRGNTCSYQETECIPDKACFAKPICQRTGSGRKSPGTRPAGVSATSPRELFVNPRFFRSETARNKFLRSFPQILSTEAIGLK